MAPYRSKVRQHVTFEKMSSGHPEAQTTKTCGSYASSGTSTKQCIVCLRPFSRRRGMRNPTSQQHPRLLEAHMVMLITCKTFDALQPLESLLQSPSAIWVSVSASCQNQHGWYAAHWQLAQANWPQVACVGPSRNCSSSPTGAQTWAPTHRTCSRGTSVSVSVSCVWKRSTRDLGHSQQCAPVGAPAGQGQENRSCTRAEHTRNSFTGTTRTRTLHGTPGVSLTGTTTNTSVMHETYIIRTRARNIDHTRTRTGATYETAHVQTTLSTPPVVCLRSRANVQVTCTTTTRKVREARSRPGCQGPQRKCAGYLSTTSWKLNLSGSRKNRLMREMMRKEMKWVEKSKRSEATLNDDDTWNMRVKMGWVETLSQCSVRSSEQGKTVKGLWH